MNPVDEFQFSLKARPRREKYKKNEGTSGGRLSQPVV